MLLSGKQLSRFWREWSEVIRYQGWEDLPRAVVEDARHRMLKLAGFNSLTEVDKKEGFDRVLAELGRLQDNVDRAVEIDHPERGLARRLRSVLKTRIMPRLERRPDIGSKARAEAFAMSIWRDQFRDLWWDGATFDAFVDTLDAAPRPARPGRPDRPAPSRLAEALITLNARARLSYQINSQPAA